MTLDRVRQLPPQVKDAGVAAAVAVAMTLTISVAAEEEARREPDLLAYVLGLCVAAMVLGRRRWPMGMLIGSVGVLWVYYSLDYPAFSPAVPLAAATYFAAAAGHIRPAAVVATGVVLFGVGWQTLGEDTSPAEVVGTGTLADTALLAAVLLLGEAVRNRRAWAGEVRRRLQRAEEDREREAERQFAEERLRMARELHDVLAHTVAGLHVQAGVAADVVDDDPEQAKAALASIREQSTAAMTELKATVGLLRGGAGAPRSPAPGLAGLDSLVTMAVGAGIAVDVSLDGAVRPLPATVDLTAYRILQESLTNVVRHAHASSASVLISYEPDAIVVQVDDDGHGGGTQAGNGAGGYGLVGMRERAAAVDGTLAAGPRPGGGFRVRAELPTAGASR